MQEVIIEVKDGRLIWQQGGEVLNEVSLDKVKLIAEYTTTDGPRKEDWFLKLILSDSESYEVSMEYDRISEVLEALGAYFGIPFRVLLKGKKDWQSNILYPTKLNGKPLWLITEIPPQGLLDWLKTFFFLGKRLDFSLTKEAHKIIHAAQ